MIKKGLSASSNSFISRPKTAHSNYKYVRENRQTLDRLRSTDSHDISKKSNKKRYEVPVETPIDFESSKTPKEFEEFDSILEKAVRDLKKESERKKIKLEKYSQQKFSYAWKRFNIPKWPKNSQNIYIYKVIPFTYLYFLVLLSHIYLYPLSILICGIEYILWFL